MKGLLLLTGWIFLAPITGCQQKPVEKPAPEAAPVSTNAGPVVVTPADLANMANAVPSTGPREGNNYKVFFLTLRQNQSPAVGFPVDMWVKGKSEPLTLRTNEAGLVTFQNLPFPDATHPLMAILHYYKGEKDQAREITYPYIDSDAYRLKDVQYIPNTVTPNPEPVMQK